MSALFHSKAVITSRLFGVECIQPSVDISGELCLYSSSINSYSDVQVSSGTCNKSVQTYYSKDTMLDGGSLASHSSQHNHCPIIKDLVMGISVGQVLQGLQFLHLTLLLFRDVCCTDKSCLSQSVRQWWRQFKNLQQVYWQCWKEQSGWYA